MGLSLPTTTDASSTVVGVAPLAAAGGMRGWFATLSARDRAIYAIMIGMLIVIVAIYLFAGMRAFFGQADGGNARTQPTIPPLATSQPIAVVATALPTAVPATPTDLPTETLSPQQPTEQPTSAIIILPTHAPVSPSVTSAASPTAAVTPSVTGAPSATSVPQATRPPTPRPTPVPANPPPPQAPPPASISTQSLTLYFADASGSLYVPVQRNVKVVDNQVGRAAIEALIGGPRNGLQRLVLPDVKLLDLRINGGTATVNFDRRPTGVGDDRGFYAMTLTLTHFPNVHQVQFQINGQNIGVEGSGDPILRPTLNPLNPDGLAYDTATTEFLPLYFLLKDGAHDVRLIRMVPKTLQTAEGTVRALIEGPGAYANRVRTVIPNGTQLRGIKKTADGTIIVDFTQPFADAGDRAAVVRTIVESLTTLKTVSGVQFLVEGHSLADQWGASYGKVFGRRAINPE